MSCLYTIYPLAWWRWKNPKNWFWYIYECNSQFFRKFQKTMFMITSCFFHENYWFFYVFDIIGTNGSLILILPSFSPISLTTILIIMDILCCTPPQTRHQNICIEFNIIAVHRNCIKKKHDILERASQWMISFTPKLGDFWKTYVI